MTWEFETAWDIEQYERWASGQLDPEFEYRQTANSHFGFGRFVEGDAETLTIETVPDNGKLHVTINLLLYPD